MSSPTPIKSTSFPSPHFSNISTTWAAQLISWHERLFTLCQYPSGDLPSSAHHSSFSESVSSDLGHGCVICPMVRSLYSVLPFEEPGPGTILTDVQE